MTWAIPNWMRPNRPLDALTPKYSAYLPASPD
jgi:hypothetical protein